jgi:hypothetical protein
MTPDDPKSEKEVVLNGNQPVSSPSEENQKGLQAALQKISQEKPHILHEMMAMGFSAGGNPFQQKMNEGHVTQVLDLVTKHDERQYELSKTSAVADSRHRTLTTWFGFIGALVFCGLLVFVILIFKDKPEVLTPILTGLGGLVTGGLGGFGFGRSIKKEE